MLRIGFIGAGFIADYHAAAVQALGAGRLAWVVDADRRRAESLQRKWGFGRAGASASELLAERRPDVVHVLVPPSLHARMAEAALDAGAHVLVEKPLAASWHEGQSLVALARKRRLVAAVNHNALFHPAFVALVRRIRRGDLGAVEHVIASWNMPLPQLDARQYDNWMLAGPLNIVLEQAVHPLSQVQFLLGEFRQVSAQAAAGRLLPTGARFVDRWSVSIEAERGTAQCHLGFGRSFCDHWLHVTGEDGAAFADLRRNTLRVTTKGRFVEAADDLVDGWRSGASLAWSATAGFAAYAGTFLKLCRRRDPFYVSMEASIGAFYRALATGAEPPATAAFGARLVRACEAMAAASAAEPLLVETP
ncbi:MAG TPA: Gfo/Idh/MocA family oxidoreductase [Vicinamibacterales bacterium]|nr:Gfo/Idh/MocA family oxidoreductase [Vicinamibacterales bacterium]